MKIKEGFKLFPVMGDTVVVATGKLDKEFGGLIKLNETSVDIWRLIEQGLSREEVISRYRDMYGIDDALAARDVDEIVSKMSAAGIFENEDNR